MKKGDLVRGYEGWLGRITGFGKYGSVCLVWQTGPLAKREARVVKESVRRVG